MTIKYTRTTLEKLVVIFEEVGYRVRFEKGNFQSGYCLVQSKKIAVVNKFFETKGRISVLLDILSNIKFEPSQLSEKSISFLNSIGMMYLVGELV